ncbi:MAG TPA: PAS domain-containing sensor histidine kinase [Stellaceae bacterium]|nr:PAS domain-containing sensor histidine kinase [Stellaceae bacterium]
MKRPAGKGGVTRVHVARFVLISVIFTSIQVAALALGWASLRIVNTTRAYATGESYYSKAANAAVLSLYKYAESGNEADWRAFHADLGVTFGDRAAREALTRPHPDIAAAIVGFRRGRNDDADIPDAILVFRLFHAWGPFAAAVEDWQQGDHTIDRLLAVAADLHALWHRGPIGAAARSHAIADIDRLDRQLTALENSFCGHIAETARIATHLVTRILLVASVLLWSFGVGLAWRTYRKGIGAEVQLWESEERFRNFAETASDWFWETDPALTVTYLSERFFEATGVSPQDLLGQPAAAVGTPILADPADTAHESMFAERRAFRGCIYRYVRAPGDEQYWKIGGSPVFDGDGAFLGYRGTGSNVTAEIRAEQALRDAKELADSANRAKSEFLANMSHELRTPLNAIMGFSEITKDRIYGERSDKYFDYARDIFNSGALLLSLIDDILDLAKIEAERVELQEEVVDLATLLQSSVLLVRQKADAAAVRVVTRIADRLPPVRADQRRLKQIILNLLSNAVKFTPAGGTISISAGVRDSDGMLEIRVRDTGIGIAPDHLAMVLEPFGQVQNSFTRRHDGTGLGLPLVKALAELHGGSCTLTSRLGHGTEVVITLPRERLIGAAARPANRTGAALALGD